MRRAPLSLVVLVSLAAFSTPACATDPALMTRDERALIAQRGAAELQFARESAPPILIHASATAPARPMVQPAAACYAGAVAAQPAAPAPKAPVTSQSSAIAELNARESKLCDRYFQLRQVRERNIALVAALRAWERDRSPRSQGVVEKSFEAYRESAAVNKIATCLTVLALAGCNSVSGQINSLNGEEKELMNRISGMQDHRKCIIALVAALQQVQRDGSSKSEERVAKLRQDYEATRSKAE